MAMPSIDCPVCGVANGFNSDKFGKSIPCWKCKAEIFLKKTNENDNEGDVANTSGTVESSQEVDPFEEAAENFARFFTIKYRDWDVIMVSDRVYICRKCANTLRRSQNCPNCKKAIDWANGIVGVQTFFYSVLKDDKSDIDPRGPGELVDKVKGLSDIELISLSEGLFDNINKSDLEMLKTVTFESDLRYFATNGFFERWLKRKQYNNWKALRERIHAKTTKFVIKNILTQS